MAITAENLAVKHKIPREKVDEFALRSQQFWKAANENGVFKSEIAPFPIKIKGKDAEFAVDEHPKWVNWIPFGTIKITKNKLEFFPHLDLRQPLKDLQNWNQYLKRMALLQLEMLRWVYLHWIDSKLYEIDILLNKCYFRAFAMVRRPFCWHLKKQLITISWNHWHDWLHIHRLVYRQRLWALAQCQPFKMYSKWPV